jgi:hypothetical protein
VAESRSDSKNYYENHPNISNHWREMNVTQSQLDKWQSGELIQNAMPQLSASDREFIKTGITAAEWADMFGDSDG